MNNPLLWLGGTFDPIHYGHLRIALEIKHYLALDEIRFLPCKTPVLKSATHSLAKHRIAMLELALAKQPGLVIDDYELNAAHPSYTVITFATFQKIYPNHPLCFAIGVDAFSNLPQWHEWHKLLDVCHLILVPRLGYSLPNQGYLFEWFTKHQTKDLTKLQQHTAGFIYVLNTTPLIHSATLLRNLVKQGLTLQYLTPDNVCSYIQEHRLYKT